MTLCRLPGDGIGPEFVAQAKKVLEAVAERFGHEIELEHSGAATVGCLEMGSLVSDAARGE